MPALSHGREAIRESLTRIEPLLDHDGLTAWYIRMAVPLVAFVVLFISRTASLTNVRALVSSGAFWAGVRSFGRNRVRSASTSGVGCGATVRARRVPYHALAAVDGTVSAFCRLGIGRPCLSLTTSCSIWYWCHGTLSLRFVLKGNCPQERQWDPQHAHKMHVLFRRRAHPRLKQSPANFPKWWPMPAGTVPSIRALDEPRVGRLSVSIIAI